MGRELLISSTETFSLFGTGVTAAVFSSAGMTPVSSDSFIMLRIVGHQTAKHDLNRFEF